MSMNLEGTWFVVATDFPISAFSLMRSSIGNPALTRL